MRKTLLIAAVLFPAGALSADPAPAPETSRQPDLSKLQAALENEKPDSIAPSAIPGLYEVVIGGQVLYLSLIHI